jgi:hypothetical protein
VPPPPAPEDKPSPAEEPPAARADDSNTRVATRRVVPLLVGAGAALVLAAAAWVVFQQREAARPDGIPAAVPVAGGAVAAVAPQPRGFEIRDQINRVLAEQNGGFKVEARAQQATLRIGRDKLAFTVSSSRDGFVQVLVLSPDGSLRLLFPNTQSSNNRIKAGQTLRLPQANWLLDTAEPAGVEEFLVIVSAQPREYGELSKERDYIFLKLPTGQAGAELARGWTRGTPLLLGTLQQCPAADCQAYGAARFTVKIDRGHRRQGQGHPAGPGLAPRLGKPRVARGLVLGPGHRYRLAKGVQGQRAARGRWAVRREHPCRA